ncbi:MAG: DUF4038 domain-containing protein [Opitutaceae bacterium]|nr:DUF4038 domain-containing protein [Opitutaceae bacterium]
MTGLGLATWAHPLAAAEAGQVPPGSDSTSLVIPRWEVHEFVARGRHPGSNPFGEALFVGEFTAPSGKTFVTDGFHDGDDAWRLRFAPDEEGDWSYVLRGGAVQVRQRGRFRCTRAHGHGFIRVHPENPYAFAHADGTAFFPMGDTCYGLLDDSPITPELRAEYLRTRRGQRFNFIRMQVGHSYDRAAADSTYWAWGGTAQEPDFDRLNPVFFRRMDELVRQMRAAGMNIELILLNLYRPPFRDTRQWTPARERLWLRYLLARYAAFDHIFLWTIANEYELHPDAKYRLDHPDDVDWAKATARFVKSHDPYRHLVTIHPVVSASTKGSTARDPIDPPWRIGEFFGVDDAMDVLSQQTGKTGEGTTWDDKLQCWTGDAVNLLPSLRADLRYRKPVLNTENGYEYLRGYPTGRRQVHHTDKVRRTSWQIVCGGGYFSAGFRSTLGHSDSWNRIDAPNRYGFIIRDEGAAAQLGILFDTFSGLPFWRMRPFDGVTNDAVALAEPGNVYVIYLPHGGSTKVDLTTVEGMFAARWLNPRTGDFEERFTVNARSVVNFQAPGAGDWTLELRRIASDGRSN